MGINNLSRSTANEIKKDFPAHAASPLIWARKLLQLSATILILLLLLDVNHSTAAFPASDGNGRKAFNAHMQGVSTSNDTTWFIVDTDMGLDDVRAVFALLPVAEERIKCFVTVEGSSSLGKACDNMIGLLESTGIDDIPIYRGFTGIEKVPPWRNTSNTLANTGFPPPHDIEISGNTTAGVCDLISGNERKISYIALGPLTNPARFEERKPGILKKLGELVVPARISSMGGEKVLESWNLAADEKSTEKVMHSAREILVIDVSCSEEINAREVLERISPSSVPQRWIKNNFTSLMKTGAHLFLYDELIIPGILDPSSLDISVERYSFDRNKDGLFILRRDPGGNIRIASIKNCGDAVSTLRKNWGINIPGHAHHEKPEIPARTLIKYFHGHLGPYVVLGFRASRLALESLGHSGHFGITADVFSTLKPPRSCFIDGVQLGSGCTLGKRNIRVHPTEVLPHVKFSTFEGDTIGVSLKDRVPGMIDSLIQIGGVEYAGDRVLEMDADSLFTIMEYNRE